MTEKRFNEIVARQQQPVFGIPSQARTDIAELISEIGRRQTAGDAVFEPEPLSDDTQEALRTLGIDPTTMSPEDAERLRELDGTLQAEKASITARAAAIAGRAGALGEAFGASQKKGGKKR